MYINQARSAHMKELNIFARMENILRNVSNLRNNGYILCKIHRRLLLKMKEIAFCGGTCPWTPYIYHPPPTSTPPIGDPAGATANGAIFQLFIIL